MPPWNAKMLSAPRQMAPDEAGPKDLPKVGFLFAYAAKPVSRTRANFGPEQTSMRHREQGSCEPVLPNRFIAYSLSVRRLGNA